jgi:hypothetical protein
MLLSILENFERRSQRGLNTKRPTLVFFSAPQETSPIKWIGKPARVIQYYLRAQGADPDPPSSTRGKTGRNHLKEEITPLLATGIGKRYSQTIPNLEHAALLPRYELPTIQESAALTQGAL